MNTKKIYFIFNEDHHRKMRRIFAPHSKPETVKKPQGINKACISSFIEKNADTEKIERVSGTIEKAPIKKNTKRRDYFISIYDKKIGQSIKKVSGQVIQFEGLEFGLNRPCKKSDYTITDLLTGCAVGHCKTIIGAVDALTPDLMSLLRNKHKEKVFIKQIEAIRAAYEHESMPFC